MLDEGQLRSRVSSQSAHATTVVPSTSPSAVPTAAVCQLPPASAQYVAQADNTPAGITTAYSRTRFVRTAAG